jgi:hypothetical protein
MSFASAITRGQQENRTMDILAYCDRSGVIGYTAGKLPAGRLPIARGEKQKLDEAIGGLCRLAYDNKTMLVPGIPEAQDDDEALEALATFTKRVRDSMARE